MGWNGPAHRFAGWDAQTYKQDTKIDPLDTPLAIDPDHKITLEAVAKYIRAVRTLQEGKGVRHPVPILGEMRNSVQDRQRWGHVIIGSALYLAERLPGRPADAAGRNTLVKGREIFSSLDQYRSEGIPKELWETYPAVEAEDPTEPFDLQVGRRVVGLVNRSYKDTAGGVAREALLAMQVHYAELGSQVSTETVEPRAA